MARGSPCSPRPLSARWADQSESATTMTTQAVTVGRAGGLLPGTDGCEARGYPARHRRGPSAPFGVTRHGCGPARGKGAPSRVSKSGFPFCPVETAPSRGLSPKPARSRLCGRSEHRDRVPMAEGKYERYPALAADLVRLKVDVIVAVGGAAT